jgi:hypothetical protein
MSLSVLLPEWGVQRASDGFNGRVRQLDDPVQRPTTPSAGTRGAGPSTARWVAVGVFVATLAQLVVAAVVTDLPQFSGKAFGARLVAYPVLMLAVPTAWALRRRLRGGGGGPVPWSAFALVMAPFLVDVTGNTLDLYDTVVWWDDANHLVNWFLLCTGLGLLLAAAGVRPRWALGWLVAGVGALLAIGWELGEWYTFIRHGTELASAYEDTLGDQALGTVGAALAGVVVARRSAAPAGGSGG